MPLRVNRVQRAALHPAAILALAEISDAFEHGDYRLAQHLRPRHEAVMRLLDDIGWGAHDPGRHFDLTLPAGQLALAADHLSDRARSRPTSSPLGLDCHPFHDDAMCAEVVAVANALLQQTGPASDARAAVGPLGTIQPVLTRDERGLLQSETLDDLRRDGITIAVAVRFAHIRLAKEQRAVYEAACRLLDDLGWAPEDEREQFVLTAPDPQLMRALARIQVTAGVTAIEHLPASCWDPERGAAMRRSVAAVGLCRRLLASLPNDETTILAARSHEREA